MNPSTNKPIEKQTLSRRSLISYGSLAVPLQALMNPILIFLPTFYATEAGLDLALVGLIFFFARTWDAITDPIVGALSDRTSGRFGRRRPWIIVGTPLLMLTSFYVLQPPESAGTWSIGLAIFLFYACWTLVYIPYQSWGSEVSTDYGERTRVAGYREAGTVLGVLIGMGIPLLLVDPFAEPVRQLIWTNGLNFDASLSTILSIIFVTVAILLPITAMATCLFMPDKPRQLDSKISWRQSLTVLKRNNTLRRLVAGYFLAQLGFLTFLASVQLLIVKGLQIKEFLFLIFIQHLVAIAAVPIWLRIAKLTGKHRAYCVSLALSAIGLLCLNFVPQGDLGLVAMLFLFNGLGSSGKLIFPPAIAADTVDYDTLKTGTQEAGTHMAVLNLANKATFAISVGLAYPLLALAGFDPKVENTPEALNALMIVSTIAPACILLLGIVVMWHFPLNERRVLAIRRRIGRREQPQDPTITSE